VRHGDPDGLGRHATDLDVSKLLTPVSVSFIRTPAAWQKFIEYLLSSSRDRQLAVTLDQKVEGVSHERS
jgi:hypothetical protein